MRTSTTRTATIAVCTVAAVGLGVAASAQAGGTAVHSSASAATRSTPPPPTLPRPRDFVRVVDNPYLPFVPGTRWVYKGYGEEAGERNVVMVLHRTKVIEGITATVVHDVVLEGKKVTEDTRDWYAQDRLGNVWYLGERSKEFQDGKVDTSGSWQAGVNGAKAGILMPADPVLDRSYAQEFEPGDAEDQAKVIDLDGQIGVPFGHFDHVRVTSESSALEPKVVELKFYAKGVGVASEIQTSPRYARTALVKMTKQ
ncbi:hypothetical protein [Nocardioides mesophilus]|uniref:DUF3068 domain-containing protein n=1 Tax=Nocardioides mesophilus TaxID=433659 RepID=A0A7G9R9X3_9ACTN|nr:hypothetical protein [Nocardioides mesophilus]QNN52398.1 hypothetical protein H9L09_18260 [Nocardioides mesophilus]